MEIWKNIEGYENYQVSNLGNVRNLNYNGTKGNVKNLVPKKNNSGRLWVELWANGRGKIFLIHRLVGMAFIPNPDNLPQINHKDENPLNNCVENLEWCTASYNVKYSARLHPERFRNRHYSNHKGHGNKLSLKINQYDLQGNFIRSWDNSRTIFLETGMSDWSITQCCRGNRHTAYGYTWQYAN